MIDGKKSIDENTQDRKPAEDSNLGNDQDQSANTDKPNQPVSSSR